MALRDLRAFFEDDGLDYPLPESAYSVDSDGKPKFPAAKACQKPECQIDERHCHYTVPSPDAKTGLWLTALADLGVRASTGAELSTAELDNLKLDDDDEKSLYKRVLGPVYGEMVADSVKWSWLQRTGQDAYVSFAMSPEAADGALESLGKAPPNRRQRRTAKKTAGRKSGRASTGSATQTPPPGSTDSSTSPAEPGAAEAG